MSGTRCQGNWFGTHRFEARFDVEPVIGKVSLTGAYAWDEMIMDKMSRRTYAHDICVRCGSVISRPHG